MAKRTWLLVAVLAACTDAHGPEHSTQTGNPPALDRGRVTLEVSADQVHIVGEAGAASPGGASIEITNLSTGQVITGTAAADGSFDVRADGSLNDAFVVRAVANGDESAPVYVVRGGAEISGEDDGSLACDQYSGLGRAVLEASAAAADRRCSSADDCKQVFVQAHCVPGCTPVYASNAGASQVMATAEAINAGLCASSKADGCPNQPVQCAAPAPVGCVAGECVAQGEQSCDQLRAEAGTAYSQAIQAAVVGCERDDDCVEVAAGVSCLGGCGWAPAVHQSQQTVFERTVADINAGVCAGFHAGGCRVPTVSCGPGLPGPPVCEAGQCIRHAVNDDGLPACTTCFTEVLAWGMNGGLAAWEDVSEVAPCARYKHRRRPALDPAFEEVSCERDIVACNQFVSTGAIMSALGDADVQSALAESPVLYGTEPRGVDGQLFRVTLADKMIEVGGSCEGAPPNCIPAPPGVTQLVELLQDIDEAMLMTEECADFPR